MVLISGALKGPYGDSRSGVTITMRSIKTSSTVLNLAKSQSVTDDTGRYSLNIEPGAYEVIVSVYGAQPERVGTIEVYTDSLPGTLNDFLRRPGESDITPEIVQTVDRLRADAALSADKSAASAAAAKQSEVNSGLNAGMLAAGRYRIPGTGAATTWVHLGTVNGLIQTGDTLRIEITGSAGYNGRTDQNGIATIVLRTGNGTGKVNTNGRAGMTIYQQSGVAPPILNAAFSEVAENKYEIYLQIGANTNRSFYVLEFESIASAQRIWTHVGVAKEPPPPNDMMLKFIKVWSDSSPIPKSGLDNNIVYRGDYGVGGSSKGFMAATTTDLMKACQAQGGGFVRNNSGTAGVPQFGAGVYARSEDTNTLIVASYQDANLFVLTCNDNSINNVKRNVIWGTANTTVDANGFIKKASPIIRLSSAP
ncbi:TPA: hypothetical protein I8438_005040, partial [Serratia marcescens]|nr:hypothetical protein [Serratia marcescens]HAT2224413.1 hypothetical protein [Serratia marcescens]HAT2276786.1 hypothetical protein [Serratia marcescens]HAT2335409.1 hypothetical protein [Serratia marcescens]HAT2357681.1 hypothetical protein [Serratia marcescens]